MNAQANIPSEAGFSAADHILRRSIPYYWKEAYVPDVRMHDGTLKEGSRHILKYPKEFGAWTIQISFTQIEGREDIVWVRCTNWRCEHEPNGAMRITHARDLYRRLVAEGMQAI